MLAERYLVDDSNRIGGQAVVLAAPAVACDAEALPFADDTFDYVVCSHLIEHVDHPDRVLDELSRVARAGYLECPDEAYDKLDTPAYHRWFVSLEDGVLVLRQKDQATFDADVKSLVHGTLYGDSGFWTVFWRHLDRFFIMLSWEGRIRYRVEYLPLEDGSPGSAERCTFDDPAWVEDRGFNVPSESADTRVPADREGSLKSKIRRLAWAALRSATRSSRAEADVLDLVACPSDKTRLTRDGENLVCPSCAALYPVVNGIPYLYRMPTSGEGHR